MLSIVIPAYNEENTIGKTLEALTSQNTNQKFEVIVVDNNSTDKTSEIAKSYKNKLNLRVINETTKGRSPARFRGFREAQGDIILSTDADTWLPPNWIEKITEPFKDPRIVAVTGTCKIDDCSRRINISFNVFQPAAMVIYRILFRHFWLSGFSFAIRADTYKKAGEFNKYINIQEDTDLAFRVRKLGKIKFMHDLPVTFSGRRFRKGLIRGLAPYATSYIKYFALKKSPHLSDVR